jgi:ketosteroid isomerase-like protein
MSPVGYGTFVLGVLLAVAATGEASASDRSGDNVTKVTRTFLTAYAKGDREAVLAKVDPQIVIYGSDAAEVFRGVDGVRKMLEGDQKLWRGSASIGKMQDVSVVASGQLSAMTFQAPFVLNDRPSVLVRFSMVWKLGPSGWRLIQSANSAPTVGQSAEALLKGNP